MFGVFCIQINDYKTDENIFEVQEELGFQVYNINELIEKVYFYVENLQTFKKLSVIVQMSYCNIKEFYC